ncbi:MAG TPA: hypothetical protein PLT00_14435 [Verrucomicrobiota bacterium]|jgi:hypothetical protein|nr:MAG: hypothetical protein BWX84_00250 [Verrucomicrobia bacterium ADurb.Bin118]HPY31650.1 hypothetical protein [Verrucomicrobiota bacterium]HQB17897.1 hypothetical protein [Verrucomicrobiota bacterium]
MKKLTLSFDLGDWSHRMEIVLRLAVLGLLVAVLIKLFFLPTFTLILNLALWALLAGALALLLRELRTLCP